MSSDKSNIRTFFSGEVLFSEGDAGGTAYILKKGNVTLTRNTHNGWSKEIATVGSGNIIGELSMIENVPHSVTAKANEDGEAVVLTQDEYKERLQKSDKVLAMVMHALTAKLRSTYS